MSPPREDEEPTGAPRDRAGRPRAPRDRDLASAPRHRAGPDWAGRRVTAADGVPIAVGRRLALVGAVLAVLAVLATIVFAAAWAVGGSTRLASRPAAALTPTVALERTDAGAPRVRPIRVPALYMLVVTDATGAKHRLVWRAASLGGA